jgi:hypothetical protein
MTTTFSSPLVVRRATAADAPALVDLAALDSARPLAGDVVVAEADGALVAAVSRDGRAVADPFLRTADVVAMLKLGLRPQVRSDRRLGLGEHVPKLAA